MNCFAVSQFSQFFKHSASDHDVSCHILINSYPGIFHIYDHIAPDCRYYRNLSIIYESKIRKKTSGFFISANFLDLACLANACHCNRHHTVQPSFLLRIFFFSKKHITCLNALFLPLKLVYANVCKLSSTFFRLLKLSFVLLNERQFQRTII